MRTTPNMESKGRGGPLSKGSCVVCETECAMRDRRGGPAYDMKNILGYLNQGENLQTLSIGNIMQLQAFRLKDMIEEGKNEIEGRWLWAMIIDSSVADATKGRRPPLAPVAFTELLQTKRFTNDADVDGVARLYEKTATQVLGATPKLELDYMPVREGDGARLAQAFALCHALEEFSWNATELPAVEVRALLSTPMPTLRRLYLKQASLGEAGGVAVAEALGAAVERLRRSMADNGYWLTQLSEAQSDPASLDQTRNNIAVLEAVTAADLQRLAQHYLKPDTAWRAEVVSDKLAQ